MAEIPLAVHPQVLLEIAKNVLPQLTIPVEFMTQLDSTDQKNVIVVMLHVIRYLREADCLKLFQHVSYMVSPGAVFKIATRTLAHIELGRVWKT